MSAALAEVPTRATPLEVSPDKSVSAAAINAALAEVYRRLPGGVGVKVRSSDMRRMLRQLVRDLEDKTASPVVAIARRAKSSTIGAEGFQDALAAAITAARAEIGDPWWARSADDCVLLHIPARLAAFRGPLGTMIRYRRDVRAPAPRFWPGGRIPDGPEEVTPDYPRETGPVLFGRDVQTGCPEHEEWVRQWRIEHSLECLMVKIGTERDDAIDLRARLIMDAARIYTVRQIPPSVWCAEARDPLQGLGNVVTFP